VIELLVDVDADDVTDVEREQTLVGVLAELVDSSLHLDLTSAVPQVQERGLAVPALRGEPAGDAVPVGRLLAGLDFLVRLPYRRDLGAVREAMRVGLDAIRPETLQLGPALGEQVGSFVLRLLVFAATKSRSW
jgi:hypothetical protein